MKPFTGTVVVTLATAALALAGCSKSGGSSSASATPDSGASTEAAASAAPADSAAAPAAAATADATPAAAAAGAIKLDIKDAAGNAVSGDPASGKQVFQICSTCHSIDAGVNKVGPSLHGIIGRHSGVAPGFNYSSANKASGIVWSEQELYSYLQNPQAKVPGTYMTFTGVKDDQKRADVIAYLQVATK